jgi:hypothetical protein
MRNLFFTILISLTTLGLSAQSGIKSIDIAFNELIKDVKSAQYLKARMEVKSMHNVIDSLIGVQITEAFPKQVDMWILSNAQPESSGHAQHNAAQSSVGQNDNVEIIKYYISKIPTTLSTNTKAFDPNEGQSVTNDPHHGTIQPSLSVSISNNMMGLSSFITNFNEQKKVSQTSNEDTYQTLSYRIQNYRVLDTRNPVMKMRQLEIIVGSAIIRINCQGINDTAIAVKIADNINYNLVKKVFGE